MYTRYRQDVHLYRIQQQLFFNIFFQGWVIQCFHKLIGEADDCETRNSSVLLLKGPNGTITLLRLDTMDDVIAGRLNWCGFLGFQGISRDADGRSCHFSFNFWSLNFVTATGDTKGCVHFHECASDGSEWRANVPFREEGESSGHENLQLFNKHLTKSELRTCKVRALAKMHLEAYQISLILAFCLLCAEVWSRCSSGFTPVSPCLTWSRSSRVTARISCRRRSWHKSPPGRKSSAGSKSEGRQMTKSRNTS